MKVESAIIRFLIWRVKHLNDRNFVLILGGLIGIIAGFAAVVLKEAVHYIQARLTSGFDIEYANYLYLSYPFIGIIITVIIAKFIFKERLGHGITGILYDISKRSSIIKSTKVFSRMITSAITVGFGGSVGLEAPIVVTGSAIGSNVGRFVHLGYKKRTVLIGCGAAGAISAIFNSPVAGVIFSIEVILVDVTITTFIPLLIASVFGSLVSLTLLGDDVLFSFKLKDSFVAADTPFYIMLGMVCGLASVYFTRVTYTVEHLLNKVKNVFGKAVVGGVCLGLIIFVFPPIYGEGYNTIKLLLDGKGNEILNSSLFFHNIHDFAFIMVFMLAVILVKPVASAMTVGAGEAEGSLRLLCS